LEREHQIVVEGKQLIQEAVDGHLKLNYLLFSHVDKITDVVNTMGASSSNVNFIKVPQQDLSIYSVLTTCPGLIGIFSKPPSPKPKENAFPITIICDNLREPNNVGAVIRLANALPAKRVLLPKGNADPWETKAIRGSSGSIFTMPTEDNLTWKQIDEEVYEGNSVVFIADNDVSNYVPSTTIQYDKIPDDLLAGKEIFLILGGETLGISDEAKYFARQRLWKCVNIPLDGGVNSLNTSNALGIILFELRRRLLQS
jgi:16S rRNA (guanosine(1370)-2'-O)-methyltransferase